MGRDWALGYLLLLPAIAVLVGLIAYPFLYAIFLSLQNKPIGAPGTFVGFQNFRTLWSSPIFYQVIRNTLIVMTRPALRRTSPSCSTRTRPTTGARAACWTSPMWSSP